MVLLFDSARTLFQGQTSSGGDGAVGWLGTETRRTGGNVTEMLHLETLKWLAMPSNVRIIPLQFQIGADDPVFFVNFQAGHLPVLFQKAPVDFGPDLLNLRSPRQQSENNHLHRGHQTAASLGEIAELHRLKYVSDQVVPQDLKTGPIAASSVPLNC
jgi:hypothetical protein